jgi:hypothetical protein
LKIFAFSGLIILIDRRASPGSNRDVIPAVIQERLEELQRVFGLGGYSVWIGTSYLPLRRSHPRI